MKIQFQIRGFRNNAELKHRLQQPLKRLGNQISISAAAIVLEHEPDSAPPFRAAALLAVPGPDIHTEARDHTLEAAWLKVTTDLGRQIRQRKLHQDSQLKRNGSIRRISRKRMH